MHAILLVFSTLWLSDFNYNGVCTKSIQPLDRLIKALFSGNFGSPQEFYVHLHSYLPVNRKHGEAIVLGTYSKEPEARPRQLNEIRSVEDFSHLSGRPPRFSSTQYPRRLTLNSVIWCVKPLDSGLVLPRGSHGPATCLGSSRPCSLSGTGVKTSPLHGTISETKGRIGGIAESCNFYPSTMTTPMSSIILVEDPSNAVMNLVITIGSFFILTWQTIRSRTPSLGMLVFYIMSVVTIQSSLL
jgi:hypothetical protein